MINITQAQTITLFIYNIAILPVIFLSILFIFLAILNLFVKRPAKKEGKLPKKLPFITVQIPTFNDPIATRCVEKCLEFDYPKNKYEIVIVDDSTDKQTQKILKAYATKHPNLVKYAHRTNRHGFKPGALNEAMKICKGEFIAVFDADWIPKKDFLKTAIKPFSDKNVALVQTNQGFYNADTNIITRFASYLLTVFHTIIMPINNKINTVFFCGTAGMLRRSSFEEVGGWNSFSLTEDSELSVRLIMKGYKTVYIDYSTPSEVPDTYESFIKQQMRWCYGNVRVFCDNAKDIMFSPNLRIRQKIMIMFMTLGHFAAPMVLIMTFFGFGGWFLGDPKLLAVTDLWDFLSRFAYTAGFFLMGGIALYKRKLFRQFPHFIFSCFTMGLVISVANTTAFFKAIFNKKLNWYCTPKVANTNALK